MRFLFAMLLAALLLAPRLSLHAQVVDGIMAVVGGSVITYEQVHSVLFERLRREPDVDNNKVATYQQNILNGLVNQQVILNDFKNLEKKGFVFPEAIIDEMIQDEIKTHFADRADFMKQLQQQGVTYEDYRKRKKEQFIVEQMTLNNTPDPIISPHKVETFYNDHQDMFKMEDRVKMRVIVLKKDAADTGEVHRRAEEILSQIKAGASFEQMAGVYSDTKTPDAGEMGWRDISTINKAIADEIVKLKPGECSGVVDTPQSCFLVRLEERDSAHIKPLGDVRDEVERILIGREKDRLREKWISRLRAKTFIQSF
jgi:parvulin-like peptidyl-prolyl isomerase